ncbi:Pkinase-domain-containing protein [Colletotrichum eremochloae]|nr:Pkinase-domain-containing protein [Colletotrichum eremochloae]
MASNAKSRWADSEEDAALAAKLKADKEEKRRMKAEKARKAEVERLAQQARANTDSGAANDDGGDDTRPAKRRKFTPDTEGGRKQASAHDASDNNEGAAKLMRFPSGRWGKCRSVENYDKLNDIEEGTYGIFLVLEFVEHDLKSILEDMPEPFLLSEVKTLLQQLTAGVAYLHDNWILHRDLKTSNLLLNNRGQLKIADFGMARYVGDPPPKLTQLVVTLWYRSPELLLGARAYGRAVDMWSVGCIFGELLTREPLLQGINEVDQVTKVFELCGVPTQESWPSFRSLPNARSLRFPNTSQATGSVIRTKFTTLTNAGCALLNDLLSLNPDSRPSAKEMLEHKYFREDPKPKKEGMFPTFPSKAGQERRRRHEPNAPVRGQNAVELGDVDFSGIFQGRDKEERGGGFSLRMV